MKAYPCSKILQSNLNSAYKENYNSTAQNAADESFEDVLKREIEKYKSSINANLTKNIREYPTT